MTRRLDHKELCSIAPLQKHSFTSIILQWYSTHKRPLPWRKNNSPYGIWLSEVILQQTRIEQGIAYWQRMLKHFPNVETLAKATEDEILKYWQGLGYYSRARHLHAAAQQIVKLGHFPNTAQELLKLPGVGSYTAAAIGSIAFNLPMAVVDGNVYRVLARYFGISTPINSTAGIKEFAKLAQSLLPVQTPGAYNQAIMDFGALQCTPKGTDCNCCPLKDTCIAFMTGTVCQLPVKLSKTNIKERHLCYYYIVVNGFVAFRRRNSKDIWQGLWEPYLAEAGHHFSFESSAQPIKKGIKHILTHRILYIDFFIVKLHQRPELPQEYHWIAQKEIVELAVPKPIETFLKNIL